MPVTPFCQRLSNGITLIVTPNLTNDIVAGRIFLRAGSYFDPVDRSGTSNLVATLLTKGTAEMNAMEIATHIESVGAGVSTEANNDLIEISFKSITADFAEIFRLVGELLRESNFPEAQLTLEKKMVIERIKSQAERPLTLAFQQLREMIYQQHPYAQSLLGNEATVATISRDDLVAFHQTFVRPDRLTISLAGNLDSETAVKLVEQIFADWVNPEHQAPEITPTVQSRPATQKSLTKATKQSIVMLGHLGVTVNDPDYFVLRLIDSYLGSGLSSRLFVELREKRGLAYEVSSVFSSKLDRAIFAVYMGTANEKVNTAINGLQGELSRLCVAQLTDKELANTKSKLLGKYALTKQTTGQLVYIYGWYEALGLGWNFDQRLAGAIDQITATQIEEVSLKYFDQPYFLSVVGG